jgi:hypothetical protein
VTTPAGEFAQWIEQEHPQLFNVLYSTAVRRGAYSRTAQLHGFGDDDDSSGIDLSLTSDGIDPDLSNFTPQLQDVDVSISNDVVSSSSIVSTPDPGSDASPVSDTAGSSIANAADSVGSWLVSGAGLTALANVTTAVFRAQAASTTAQMQQQVLQAQAARAIAGQSPLPITYATNSAGQLVPVYSTASGAVIPPSVTSSIASGGAYPVTLPDGSTGYALTSSTLSSLLSTFTSNPLYLLIGLGVLFLALS